MCESFGNTEWDLGSEWGLGGFCLVAAMVVMSITEPQKQQGGHCPHLNLLENSTIVLCEGMKNFMHKGQINKLRIRKHSMVFVCGAFACQLWPAFVSLSLAHRFSDFGPRLTCSYQHNNIVSLSNTHTRHPTHINTHPHKKKKNRWPCVWCA